MSFQSITNYSGCAACHCLCISVSVSVFRCDSIVRELQHSSGQADQMCWCQMAKTVLCNIWRVLTDQIVNTQIALNVCLRVLSIPVCIFPHSLQTPATIWLMGSFYAFTQNTIYLQIITYGNLLCDWGWTYAFVYTDNNVLHSPAHPQHWVILSFTLCMSFMQVPQDLLWQKAWQVILS